VVVLKGGVWPLVEAFSSAVPKPQPSGSLTVGSIGIWRV
jgi:hypothetical protein